MLTSELSLTDFIYILSVLVETSSLVFQVQR